MSYKIKNICCIGAGYVGGPSMAVLAENCPNIKINVVDTNQERINLWNSADLDDLPIFEPGLAKIIKNCRGANLSFSNDIAESIGGGGHAFASGAMINCGLQKTIKLVVTKTKAALERKMEFI